MTSASLSDLKPVKGLVKSSRPSFLGFERALSAFLGFGRVLSAFLGFGSVICFLVFGRVLYLLLVFDNPLLSIV
jgi:hypothetical protein